MTLTRCFSTLLLLLATAISGCKQLLRESTSQNQMASPASTSDHSPVALAAADRPIAMQLPDRATPVAPEVQKTATPSPTSPQLADSVERRGPFTIAGKSFSVVLRYKHLAGKSGSDSSTLASIEIVNAAGEVQHSETFPYSIEAGDFAETCSADVEYLLGSNGQGLLLDLGCLPSAPMSGGPWEIFGMVNGKLVLIGKPMVTEGEFGKFVPGKINHIGTATQILPDTLEFRVWTGYFFATVAVRVDWFQGKLALAQHCFSQTGHGFAEDGCEMPIEDVQRTPSDQEMTFVRLFMESNEHLTPLHVVVKRDSRVDFLAAKVRIIWDESQDTASLGVGDDIWVKVRIDGKEGWIHEIEDFNAIGLYQSG